MRPSCLDPLSLLRCAWNMFGNIVNEAWRVFLILTFPGAQFTMDNSYYHKSSIDSIIMLYIGWSTSEVKTTRSNSRRVRLVSNTKIYISFWCDWRFWEECFYMHYMFLFYSIEIHFPQHPVSPFKCNVGIFRKMYEAKVSDFSVPYFCPFCQPTLPRQKLVADKNAFVPFLIFSKNSRLFSWSTFHEKVSVIF